ncbi:phosphatase PAP2 family protein [Actinokineospora auranticolor]|uniref:Undecaprenyl-diphosphatase n=1 Tax=Actinokineospora auranticolor TaxID=155976 RepID=A0A2S6GB97_9PSEU|nr:phosphatase PAP2 family protein [Actinokineospora auranticolor]PPK61083.1 undecaprenyl-diphosphatase [Actinokineospora auranticolor]
MKFHATLGVILLAAFLMLGRAVSDAAPGIDQAVAGTLGADWHGAPGDIAYAGSLVLGPVLPAVAALVLIAWALLQRSRPGRMGLLLRCVLLLAVCRAVSLVKPFFERARPRDYPDFSFPSGHVVSVASVGFTAVVLCAWLARERVKLVVFCASVAVVLAAVCRVVLDVHWLTDVFGATLGVVGAGLLTAAALRLLPARPSGVGSGT